MESKASDAEQKARQVADAARKRAARLSIATALSMLIGAFIASAARMVEGSGTNTNGICRDGPRLADRVRLTSTPATRLTSKPLKAS
jgi:hypothetical protein